MRVLRLATDLVIANLGVLNSPMLGLAVDAFGGSALSIDGLVGHRGVVQQDALQATKFNVEISLIQPLSLRNCSCSQVRAVGEGNNNGQRKR